MIKMIINRYFYCFLNPKEKIMVKQGTEIDASQLKHGQKVVVHLKGIRKGHRITYRVASISAAKLFVDHLNYRRISDLLIDGCEGKKGYYSSTCCSEHLAP